MKLPSHLAKSRYGIYYLRIERNGVEKRKSLGTRDPSVALAAAYAFGAKIHHMNINNRRSLGYVLETTSNGVKVTTNGTEADHRQAMEAMALVINANATAHTVSAAPAMPSDPAPLHPLTLKDAVSNYLKVKTSHWSAATYVTYSNIFDRFVAAFPASTLISDISAAKFDQWRNPLDATLSPDTVKRDVGALKGLFIWAKKYHHYVAENPAMISDMSPDIRKRLIAKHKKPHNTFTAIDLKKIFAATVAGKKPCDFWLPTLGLYTGARINELCSAKLGAVKEYEKGKWSLDLEGKTISSTRTIPLHPILISLGFLDYLDDVRRCWAGADRIFPYLTSDSKNGYANKPSNAFTELKQGLKLGDDKVFHSFRKTFVSCLQYNGCVEEHRRPFVGHEYDEGAIKSDKKDTRGDAHADYSLAKFDPARLAEMIFPHLDYFAYLGAIPNVPSYKAGQFDEYFEKSQRQKNVRAARLLRKERSAKL
jgi:integrase